MVLPVCYCTFANLCGKYQRKIWVSRKVFLILPTENVYLPIPMEANDTELKNFEMGENPKSGLEFRLQLMPRFFIVHPHDPQVSHTHDYYQIIWFQSGHGIHMVDFKSYPVGDNTIFFMSPGQVHAFDGNHDYRGVVIQFNASFMADEGSNENVFLKYNLFNAYDSVPYRKVSSEEADRLQMLVNEMNREYSLTGAFAHKDYMQYLLRLFLIRVQRAGEGGESGRLYVSSQANRVFVRFRQLVEENFRQKHTVAEYADLLCLSSRVLSEYVRLSSPLTPLKVINNRIILEAKRLMKFSDMKMKEICTYLGFDDASNFANFFRRETGMMPTDFKNSKQQETTYKEMRKIAIPTNEGKLWPHFGKAPQVTFVTVDNGKIADKEVLDAPEHAHGAMPKFILEHGATELLCGGLGQGAVNMLRQLGIELHAGAPAIDIDDVVNQYLNGTIEYGDSSCPHDGCQH